jgi:hypothetical protein
MRIISFIEEEDVIRKILEHLKLWEEPWPPPQAPDSAVLPVTDRSNGNGNRGCNSVREAGEKHFSHKAGLSSGKCPGLLAQIHNILIFNG